MSLDQCLAESLIQSRSVLNTFFGKCSLFVCPYSHFLLCKLRRNIFTLVYKGIQLFGWLDKFSLDSVRISNHYV